MNVNESKKTLSVENIFLVPSINAYLLLLGVNSCHDGDEFQGIFTDIEELKTAYDALLQGEGIGWVF